MFQVKDGFGISLLGELGYAFDYYNMETDTAINMGVSSMFNSFQLGLLPKFNIGFGGRHGLAIGIGGGVKIPISGNYTLNLDLLLRFNTTERVNRNIYIPIWLDLLYLSYSLFFLF